jgi:hypothetical protein
VGDHAHDIHIEADNVTFLIHPFKRRSVGRCADNVLILGIRAKNRSQNKQQHNR